MYHPKEDSFLLEKFVSLAKGKVLDIGTGAGILAATAAKNSKVKSVIAVDIDRESIE